ncbi:hypothetical protein L1987_29262 [Smallanthus sonchifolius]|uniref:Uncharacterized protein n=1 Tax=Smallanthus sonchifolius TaxID=185202 RepID=A0ACB9HYZ4_9ASTR|nr:hypothetical protein L1987_29262 [Smallanthus sonchifolius]
MVSIRRQRLIKLYGRSPFLDILSSYNNGQSTGSWVQNTKFGMHPLPSVDVEQPDEQENKSSKEPEPSTVNESSSSNKQPVLHPEFKRRKRHRRKNIENQEVCVMRGVYFKNMKWQAAIKVDKKQIHLGTVSSQEEAARLYDRAAFMCGREPNFELTIKEKDELSKLSWDEFLAMTRSAINCKKEDGISWRNRILYPTLVGGIVGGGFGLVSRHWKVYGRAGMSTYATNLAIVIGCYCGAREVVRLSRHSGPDDLLDSAIAGFGTGALLGRLQGGRACAVRYSIVIAVVGTGVDFAAIKLRPVFKNMYESVAGDEKKQGWFKWPEWLPIQVLDEEALAAKRAREEALRARIHDLAKEES